jgi:hypothetical protein
MNASNSPVRMQSAEVRVAPTAHRLLAAARLLPAGNRARYGEEYRAELWDIAHAGAGRCGQLAYAARQVMFALRSEARKRRVPRNQVAALAECLVGVAARMLPASGRARFAEEFQAELWEIAYAGTGRLGQLAYAARQLRRAWGVRAELRTPHRRQVVP